MGTLAQPCLYLMSRIGDVVKGLTDGNSGGGLSHRRPKQPDLFNALLMSPEKNLVMKARTLLAHLTHIPQKHCSRTGLKRERIDRSPHRVRVGVVAIVNQKAAHRQRMQSSPSGNRLKA